MVSDETNLAIRNFNQLLIRSITDLEETVSVLRDTLNDLNITNRELHQEIRELSSEISLLNIHLDRTPTGREGEEEQALEPAIEAQPVDDDEERPLRVGDRVRITSRQLFGTEGVIHSFTNQRVRVQVQGRRRLVIRSNDNLVRLPN